MTTTTKTKTKQNKKTKDGIEKGILSTKILFEEIQDQFRRQGEVCDGERKVREFQIGAAEKQNTRPARYFLLKLGIPKVLSSWMALN